MKEEPTTIISKGSIVFTFYTGKTGEEVYLNSTILGSIDQVDGVREIAVHVDTSKLRQQTIEECVKVIYGEELVVKYEDYKTGVRIVPEIDGYNQAILNVIEKLKEIE